MAEDAGIPGIVRDGSASVVTASTKPANVAGHPWETVYVEHVVEVKRVLVPLSEDTAILLHEVATREKKSADAWLSETLLAYLEAHGGAGLPVDAEDVALASG